MKPVKLHMMNIGPFRDETIDFTQLDNMFLIKGKTGAGKTFIFDALTFALYGRLRGNRKDYVSDLKSHYAPVDEEAYVEYEFELGGNRYCIHRNVPYTFINRKGNADSKTTSASLSVRRNVADGNGQKQSSGGWETIPGKLTEINKKVEDLIGLSPDEFAKIVILPQGEFAEFLHQNSKDRSGTLKKLFPVTFYSNMTERIKKKALDESKRFETLQKSVEMISEGGDFSDAENVIHEGKEEIDRLAAEEADLFKKLSTLSSEMEKLRHEETDAIQYEEDVRNLAELDALQEGYEERKKIIDAAERSQKLREYISTLEHEKCSLEESIHTHEKASQDKEAAQRKYDDFSARQKEMSELQSRIEAESQELNLLEDKLKHADELAGLKAEEDEAAGRKQKTEGRKKAVEEKIAELEKNFEGRSALEIVNGLQDTISKLDREIQSLSQEAEVCRKREQLDERKKTCSGMLSEARGKVASETEKIVRTKETIALLETEKQKAEEEHLAFTLAQFLKSGAPCPVCGSVEHPAPAKRPEGLLDYDEQIKTNTDNLESLQEILSEKEREAAKYQATLHEIEAELERIPAARPLVEVETQLSEKTEKRTSLSEEKDAVNEIARKLEGLNENLRSVRVEFDEAEKQFTKASESRSALEALIGEDVDNLRGRAGKLAASVQSGKTSVELYQSQFDEAKRSLSAAEAAVAQSEAAEMSFTEKVSTAQNLLEEKRLEAGFNSIEEAEKAVRDDIFLESEKAAVKKYDERRVSLCDAVQAGKKKKLRPVKDIQAELSYVSGQYNQTTEDYNAKHECLSKKNSAFAVYQQQWMTIKQNQDELITLKTELEPLQALSDTLSGNNPQKLTFETWALGLYFQQVVDYASRRFNDISDGRFSFILKRPDESTGNAQRGLDLLVLDSYTGRTRDAAELSGGETFEASISLALAITDVVQNDKGGGIQLDSLFIDEGFGTLDPETLEKAMAILTELGETRMIGMISHVSEMENFSGITSSITVDKGRNGSHIRVE